MVGEPLQPRDTLFEEGIDPAGIDAVLVANVACFIQTGRHTDTAPLAGGPAISSIDSSTRRRRRSGTWSLVAANEGIARRSLPANPTATDRSSGETRA